MRLPEETYVRKSRFDNDDMIELIQGSPSPPAWPSRMAAASKVQSAPGTGSIFWFMIPTAEDAARREEAP